MGCRSLRRVLGDARIGGFGEIPNRVRAVIDVSERVVSTLEYVARGGVPGRPRVNRVAAAEIVEHVSRVNASVLTLAHASADTLSERYLELAGELELLLSLAERVMERGVDVDANLVPSNHWKAFGPPP